MLRFVEPPSEASNGYQRSWPYSSWPGLVTWKRSAFDNPGSALGMVRLVAVVLAAGAVFVLDDAAAATVAASPTPLWWRRMLRYVVAAVFVLPAWVAVLAYAHTHQPELPWPRVTLELTVLATFGFAVGGTAIRWLDAGDPGTAAALSVLGFTFIGAELPQRLALFDVPDLQPWPPSTLRWVTVLVAAVVVLVVTTRDPARARPRRLPPSPRGDRTGLATRARR